MSLAKHILSHLRAVRCATNRDLQDACVAHGGEVSRDCARLIAMGLIKRVDAARGRGSRAMYAMAYRNFSRSNTTLREGRGGEARRA